MNYYLRNFKPVLRRLVEPKQYTSLAFGQRCRRQHVRPSMGSVGDCFDNAMAESFFATLKCELIDRVTMRDAREAKQELFSFIEGWYNPHRRHSSIDYFSPVEYERRYHDSHHAKTPLVDNPRGHDATKPTHQSLSPLGEESEEKILKTKALNCPQNPGRSSPRLHEACPGSSHLARLSQSTISRQYGS